MEISQKIEKEDAFFIKKLSELSSTAQMRNIPCFSGFLNLYEQNLVIRYVLPDCFVNYKFEGGFPKAERKQICFFDSDIFSESSLAYPIVILKISPVSIKFSEVLTHRDYLGALLNLGIDRSRIGDIVIQEKDAYIFVQKEISKFVLQEFIKVKHTRVQCSVVEDTSFTIEPAFKTIHTTVASNRLDAVLAVAMKGSRTQLSQLMKAKKVFVNNKLIENNSFHLNNDDVVSVRGFGKFIYLQKDTMSKKGRYHIILKKYI